MLVTAMIHVVPRTIAQARTVRARYLVRLLRTGLRSLSRRIETLRARRALARQYERELALLLQADERMLRDIGLTRADVVAAAQSSWFMVRPVQETRRQREDDDQRKAPADLPRLPSPSLTPGTPLLTVDTANFR
jgi:uncharacterized protein YjiS (DUF1127 family)